MKLLATHITRYLYSGPVSMCHTQVHLTPRMCPGQTVIKCEIHVNPEPDSRSSYQDYFGNDVTSFSVAEPHHELTISSRSLAEMIPRTLPELEHSPPWEQARDLVFDRSISGSLDACQFMFESPLAPVAQQFSDYATSSFPSGRPFLSGVDDLSRRIYSEFSYDPRATTVSTPVDAIFAAHRGVCQDFAHLMIACLRSLGLPARYVSGYVRTGENFVGGEASHAWVSVWCPVFGWQDFDPTNNTRPTGDHLTLAWGRDYSDVAPVKGVALGGGDQVISVSVDVSRKNGVSTDQE